MNKTVLITGASRGIGAACALLFSQRGYNVVLNYNKSKFEAEQLVKRIVSNKGSALAIRADISLRDEVENMISLSQKEFGDIDVLVNNAGIAEQKLFTDISPEDWKRMFSVNIDGTFNCTQLVAGSMIKRHKGKIINISSVWGITGASCEVHYSASKAAMIGFTKALAKELGPSGIQVNCVAPGVIDTDMNLGLDDSAIMSIKEETPLCRLGTPDEIAYSVLFLAEEKSNFITGQVLSPNGGFLI